MLKGKKMTAKKFDTQETLQMIIEKGICPLAYPIKYEGTTYDVATRVCRAKVSHRVEADAFSRDTYNGKSIPDVIMAYLASTIVEFGQLVEDSESEPKESEKEMRIELQKESLPDKSTSETKNLPDTVTEDTQDKEEQQEQEQPSYSIKNKQKVPVDFLLRELDYVDMVMLQHLLGKS